MHKIFKIYFVTNLYMFRASSVSIIRSYLLQHGNWYVSCRLCDRFLEESGWNGQPDSARKRSHNLHETFQMPCVQQITPDDGHRRCSKHVEIYDKINFGYLKHLVGCFTRNLCRVSWSSLLIRRGLSRYYIQQAIYIMPH